MLDLKLQLADGGLTLFDEHIDRRLWRGLDNIAIVTALQPILLLAQPCFLERSLDSSVSHNAVLSDFSPFAVTTKAVDVRRTDGAEVWDPGEGYTPPSNGFLRLHSGTVPEKRRREDWGSRLSGVSRGIVLDTDDGLLGVDAAGFLSSAFLALDAAESEAGSGVSVALAVVEADAALPSSASSVSSHS